MLKKGPKTGKICKQCGGDPKPLTQFYDAVGNADGKSSMCMSCYKKAQNKTNQLNRIWAVTAGGYKPGSRRKRKVK